jgi:large subunit ribosomal protein L19
MDKSIIAKVEAKYLKANVPDFRVGDTVDVHQKIVEGNRTRTQIFNGVVISRKGGGLNEQFTVRRIVANEGVERTYMLHSPLITKIEVKRRGKVRRAKLYYLRGRTGKAGRLREVRVSRQKTDAQKNAPSREASGPGSQPAEQAVAVS